MPRRAFIFRSLAQEHKLSFRTLRDEFGDLPYQTLADDVKFFQELGMELEMAKDGQGENVIIDRATRHDETKDIRRESQKKEKRAIGNVGLGLICGFPAFLTPEEIEKSEALLENFTGGEKVTELDADDDSVKEVVEAKRKLDQNVRLRRVRDELERFRAFPPDVREIEEALTGRWTGEKKLHGRARTSHEQGDAAYKALEVFWKLRTFWGEHNRAIAMDAGTTNDAIADFLRDIPLPMLVGALERLTVCTNSRGIFNVLGVAKVLTKTIMIGGEQVARSEAVAGRMSEVFINSAGILQFGLAIIGATVVDLHNFSACSETAEEANLKTILYGKSALRILCVDHTKLRQDGQMRASFPFVAIHPDQLDLVLTNAPLEPRYIASNNKNARLANEEQWRKFVGSVDIIRQHGVPVLIARHHDNTGSSVISDLAEFHSANPAGT